MGRPKLHDAPSSDGDSDDGASSNRLRPPMTQHVPFSQQQHPFWLAGPGQMPGMPLGMQLGVPQMAGQLPGMPQMAFAASPHHPFPYPSHPLPLGMTGPVHGMAGVPAPPQVAPSANGPDNGHSRSAAATQKASVAHRRGNGMATAIAATPLATPSEAAARQHAAPPSGSRTGRRFLGRGTSTPRRSMGERACLC